MRTRRSGSSYGSGFSTTACSTPNTAVFAPIPSARVATTTRTSFFADAIKRIAYLKSSNRPSTSELDGDAGGWVGGGRGYSTGGALGDRRAVVARLRRADAHAGADAHHCLAVAERAGGRRNRLHVVAERAERRESDPLKPTRRR